MALRIAIAFSLGVFIDVALYHCPKWNVGSTTDGSEGHTPRVRSGTGMAIVDV
jgi:hypothetical protein